MDTARPALSSAGEVIFEPEDKRARDWLSILEDCMSSWALFSAAKFVFITITLSVSRPRWGALILRGVLATDEPFHGRLIVLPSQPFLAADRLSCDAQVIGGTSKSFSGLLKLCLRWQSFK
jgi:hypothetical protein